MDQPAREPILIIRADGLKIELAVLPSDPEAAENIIRQAAARGCSFLNRRLIPLEAIRH